MGYWYLFWWPFVIFTFISMWLYNKNVLIYHYNGLEVWCKIICYFSWNSNKFQLAKTSLSPQCVPFSHAASTCYWQDMTSSTRLFWGEYHTGWNRLYSPPYHCSSQWFLAEQKQKSPVRWSLFQSALLLVFFFLSKTLLQFSISRSKYTEGVACNKKWCNYGVTIINSVN